MKKEIIYSITNILLIFSFSSAYAQDSDSLIWVSGQIYDALYKTPLDSVKVEVMTKDSLVVGCDYSKSSWQGGYSAECRREGTKRGATYIVKFSKEGFKDEYTTFRINSARNYYPKVVFLHHKLNAAANDILLGTATVKASLVKMVVDNDTIVYNAGAFQLAEGSMLDGLIKQLPGAEIKDNQIYVNGEFVQSLLVNGKDFFKGDPAIALENLPAYMVNKIKVFRRETEEQQSFGIYRH